MFRVAGENEAWGARFVDEQNIHGLISTVEVILVIP
jgi:hypothetical protein